MTGFHASSIQRRKVRGELCASCQRPADDPSHLISRAQGGCDDPECVIPLCRTCHQHYDTGTLDLFRIVARDYPTELEHAIEHAGTEWAAARRLSNTRIREDVQLAYARFCRHPCKCAIAGGGCQRDPVCVD